MTTSVPLLLEPAKMLLGTTGIYQTSNNANLVGFGDSLFSATVLVILVISPHGASVEWKIGHSSMQDKSSYFQIG